MLPLLSPSPVSPSPLSPGAGLGTSPPGASPPGLGSLPSVPSWSGAAGPSVDVSPLFPGSEVDGPCCPSPAPWSPPSGPVEPAWSGLPPGTLVSWSCSPDPASGLPVTTSFSVTSGVPLSTTLPSCGVPFCTSWLFNVSSAIMSPLY